MSTDISRQPVPLRFAKLVWSEYSIILVTIVIFIVAGLIESRFIQFSNIILILRQAAIVGVIAMGMTIVIITGGIDLSSGHVVAASGAVLIVLQGNAEIPIFVAILACIAAATAIGTVNGIIITRFRLPPFIVTLAVGIIVRSVALYLVDGRSIVGRRVPEFNNIGTGSIGFIPNSLAIWIVLGVVLAIILTYTKFGSYVFAVGGNETAARYSGIPVNKVKIAAYAITGLCAGLSALLDFSRMSAIAVSTAGVMYEFDAITAAVLGGAALSGGRGKMLSTFFGVIIIMVVTNMMVMFGFSIFLSGTVMGTIILVGVLLQKRDKAT